MTKRWAGAVVAIVVGVLGAGGGSAAAASSSYCSETGDYCYRAAKVRGSWRISLSTFSFQGRVRTCVTAPDATRTCRRFRVREGKYGIYSFDVRWSKHFPNRGRGRYRVAFFVQGNRIGPGVSFRR